MYLSPLILFNTSQSATTSFTISLRLIYFLTSSTRYLIQFGSWTVSSLLYLPDPQSRSDTTKVKLFYGDLIPSTRSFETTHLLTLPDLAFSITSHHITSSKIWMAPLRVRTAVVREEYCALGAREMECKIIAQLVGTFSILAW